MDARDDTDLSADHHAARGPIVHLQIVHRRLARLALDAEPVNIGAAAHHLSIALSYESLAEALDHLHARRAYDL